MKGKNDGGLKKTVKRGMPTKSIKTKQGFAGDGESYLIDRWFYLFFKSLFHL
jgi:hypothetical protein